MENRPIPEAATTAFQRVVLGGTNPVKPRLIRTVMNIMGSIAAARIAAFGSFTARCNKITKTIEPKAQLPADASTVPIGPSHGISVSFRATFATTQITM
jgi:hypothetical protein